MSKKPAVKTVRDDLDVLPFPRGDEGRITVNCLNCSLPLSLSQPNPNSSERLLGVCQRCEHWFLVDRIAGQTEWLVCELPDIELIRQIAFDDPSE